MDVRDLMVGDWFAFQGHPYKCTADDMANLAKCEKNGAETSVSEIPLTAEILEKNGFDKHNDIWRVIDAERLDLGVLAVGIDDGCGVGFCVMPDGEITYFCKYVHQLQNALRVFGIENDIVL